MLGATKLLRPLIAKAPCFPMFILPTVLEIPVFPSVGTLTTHREHFTFFFFLILEIYLFIYLFTYLLTYL